MGSKFAKPKDLLQPPPVCKKGPKRKISTVPPPPPLGCAWDPPALTFASGGSVNVELHAFPDGVPDGTPLGLFEAGDLAADLDFSPNSVPSGETTEVQITDTGPNMPGNYSLSTNLDTDVETVCEAIGEITLT